MGAPNDSKPEDDEELINVNDFESIQIQIQLKNLTTKTEPKKGSVVRFIEFLDRGMVLEVPQKNCNKSHHLILDIQARAPGKKDIEFSVTAKVDDLEHLEGGTDQVSMSVIQTDEKSWADFNKLFSNRQEEIEKFLAAVRGY